MQPDSCDTFVVMPSASSKNCIIFGKNSDRPCEEVQEVVFVPAEDHEVGSSVQCTYIEIPQVQHTYAMMLSKPAWLWGAEMGANEHEVCIGNEAVWTKDLDSDDTTEALLGMDLLRLGLERGSTAREALQVITELLQRFGQGGPCSEEEGLQDFVYHNSFIIADPTEAWVLETSGHHWAAEKVTGAYRNISNLLTIGTQIDLMSDGLQEYAKEKGYWNGRDPFHFATIFTEGTSGSLGVDDTRYVCGKKLLSELSKDDKFTAASMMTILRDKPSGICKLGSFATTGSQVSVLFPADAKSKSCHWFTATPNPNCSVFKPFVFCKSPAVSKLTESPSYGDADPVKIKPRFQSKPDRQHLLYKAHNNLNPLPGKNFPKDISMILKGIEAECIKNVEERLENFDKDKEHELADLFKDGVETEMKFYVK